ncbi:polyketide synthase [Colletotrichum tofieldiae]|nr:polyketide synthase [Colletotrichum tofieldiae]GKT74347.1 polyketide synthase [Colletotrichum tofieldiae]
MAEGYAGCGQEAASNHTNGTPSTNGTAGVNGYVGMNGSADVNGFADVNGSSDANGSSSVNGSAGVNGSSHSSKGFIQDPIAVVGLACRLPDNCNTPHALWKFLESGSIAKNTPPQSRFNIETHYDGSLKNKTMASPGGMFLQNVDPADIDAQFFKLSRLEAVSMDPQQRQLLEVVYEGLENAGVALEHLDGKLVGCFVASFACDYGDMQARDPEDRAAATVVGIGRAMLSNRISHFLNIHGPSMTIDTACSGSLTGLDVACRYLHTKEINSAIVAGCNIYLSPEHVMDHHMGANGTASLSGKCHTFDEKADGYIKAEAVNMVYIKRLSDAIRDGDPIRAIIRGTATNSDGWTAGIASPNSEAQARAIRQAYANAGITDLSATSYVECHGTGTRAGDVIEVNGVAAVFGPSRPSGKPLRIGSVKANIGHSEPGAGISGLLKTILSLEKGIIPGNPTFITPNPKLDFASLKVLPSKEATRWPAVPFRRASVNSFGYGGSNAHVILDAPVGLETHVSSYLKESADLFEDEETAGKPYILAFSANDDQSLRAQYVALDRHLMDPSVKVDLRDLAYTLSEKRTKHYHRGYTVTRTSSVDLQSLTVGSVRPEPPRLGFIFTGQGAQWSEMGKELIETFPAAASRIRHLDEVLQSIPEPCTWTLFDMLTKPQRPEDLKRPEISQPICTALQLALLAVIDTAGIRSQAVAGHSSGEIAAAVAAGFLTPAQAIKIAYYRGQATSAATFESPVGMLAAGLGADAVAPYLHNSSVQIACFNSPASVTLSGKQSDLESLESKLKADGHFARLLQVSAAYHSRYMHPIASLYRDLLETRVDWTEPSKSRAAMFSSTTGKLVERSPGPEYWVQNMVTPVLFSQSISAMLSQAEPVNVLIEIGPSNALSGPVNQIKTALSKSTEYIPAWKRGAEALQTFLDLAGKLFIMGSSINLAAMNKDDLEKSPSFITDLPNYQWNHSTKYWYENEASVDWRFRKFSHHDLLGGKVLGTPWNEPVWKKVLKLSDLPWLQDHKIGDGVIFPASGYVAMAVEAIFQKNKAIGRLADNVETHQVSYKLRDISFSRAMPLEDQDQDTKILFSLTPCSSTKDSWHEFNVSSLSKSIAIEHCKGRISIVDQPVEYEDLRPFRHSTPAALWYKAMRDVGYNFGPGFQRLQEIEATAGLRENRASVSFAIPESKTRQSVYPLHPASIDSCFQAGAPSLWSGHRSSVGNLMLPVMIDELVISAHGDRPEVGIAVANARFTGIGRIDDAQRYKTNVSVFNEKNGELLLGLSGLRFHAVESSNKSQSHPYSQTAWKPDYTFLSNERLARVLESKAENGDDSVSAAIGELAGLVAHKNPGVKIKESSLVGSDSFWIDHVRPIASQISADCEYLFSVPSQDAGLESRTKYARSGNVTFGVHDPENPFAELHAEGPFGLLIVRTSRPLSAVRVLLESVRRAVSDDGFLLVLQENDIASQNGSLEHFYTNGDSGSIDDNFLPGFEMIPTTLNGESSMANVKIAYFGAAVADGPAGSMKPPVHLVRFQNQDDTKDIENALQTVHGWQLLEQALPLDNLPDGCTVVVLDEILSPVISNISDEQYLALQKLVEKRCRLLWVTAGAQMHVTHPEQSLFVGVARSLRSEDPGALILCLDVESSSGSGSIDAIDAAIKHLLSADTFEFSDSEFAERDGLLHVCRIVPDNLINQSEEKAVKGAEPQVRSLHNQEPCIRLISDRPGRLESLHWAESRDHDILEDHKIEVEVHATALNFKVSVSGTRSGVRHEADLESVKDLANVMGFVPANEHQTGFEASGIVTRVGKDIDKFHPGDRVVIIRRDGGCFANKVKHIVEGVHLIPDWMSFEVTKPPATVLIHSASGGVGLAAIQLCKYFGAEIYVTVGSEQKRKFLRETCGIPEDRMFSSRSVTFAPKFMKATNGRGADIILNSLTGDMLHESWRCIAENGRFIEIGKKDMLDRHNLSMEPFSWNASYRAFDLSLKCITDATAHRQVGRAEQF